MKCFFFFFLGFPYFFLVCHCQSNAPVGSSYEIEGNSAKRKINVFVFISFHFQSAICRRDFRRILFSRQYMLFALFVGCLLCLRVSTRITQALKRPCQILTFMFAIHYFGFRIGRVLVQIIFPAIQIT